MRLLIWLLFPALASCSTMRVDAEQLICLFCIHTKVKAEKKPAEAGLEGKDQEAEEPAPDKHMQKD